jgi:hypothetical protein
MEETQDADLSMAMHLKKGLSKGTKEREEDVKMREEHAEAYLLAVSTYEL